MNETMPDTLNLKPLRGKTPELLSNLIHRTMLCADAFRPSAEQSLYLALHCSLFFNFPIFQFSHFHIALIKVSMSLSPRPDKVSTTTSVGLKFTMDSAPSAWADSSAGIIPSIRVNSKAAFKAS